MPGTSTDPEAILGEEAHIVGERQGAARHESLSISDRDAYENRILLCRNDHVRIDRQPGEWTVGRLHALKAHHEQLMAARTSHGERGGIIFEPPAPDKKMGLLVSGKSILDVIDGSLAYQSTHEQLDGQVEREAAASLLQNAQDWGDILSDIGPAGRIDAETNLADALHDAIEQGLLLYGVQLEVTVRIGEARERWPVAYLHLRRAENIRAEQRTSSPPASADAGVVRERRM